MPSFSVLFVVAVIDVVAYSPPVVAVVDCFQAASHHRHVAILFCPWLVCKVSAFVVIVVGTVMSFCQIIKLFLTKRKKAASSFQRAHVRCNNLGFGVPGNELFVTPRNKPIAPRWIQFPFAQ